MAKPGIIIVHLRDFPSDESTGNHLRRICRGLQLEGWNPMVLAAWRSPNAELGTKEGVDRQWNIPYSTTYVPVRRAPFFIAKLFWRSAGILAEKLRAALQAGNVRAVLFFGSSYLGSDELIRMCSEQGVTTFTYEVEYPVLNNWPELLNGYYFDHLQYIRRSLKRVSGIIGISSFWADLAREIGVPSTIVPSYLPDEVFALPAPAPHRNGKSTSDFHVVTLGRWLPREQPAVLLNALRQVRQKGAPVRYTAVGPIGTMRRERPAVNLYKDDPLLREVVNLPGWLGNEEKMAVMDSADAYVILRRSNRETEALFPTRLPEYLARARTVIASDVRDLNVYLEHEKSAWLIPEDDDGSELARAIETLYKDRELADRIGAAGRAKAIESFSIERNGKTMSEFIKRVAAAKRTSIAE